MSETNPCPECGEEILAVATKCEHCDAVLDKEAVGAERAGGPPGILGRKVAPRHYRETISCVLLCAAAVWFGATFVWGLQDALWPEPAFMMPGLLGVVTVLYLSPLGAVGTIVGAAVGRGNARRANLVALAIMVGAWGVGVGLVM